MKVFNNIMEMLERCLWSSDLIREENKCIVKTVNLFERYEKTWKSIEAIFIEAPSSHRLRSIVTCQTDSKREIKKQHMRSQYS